VVGGTAGQVLAKIDSTDYNTQWVNQSGGGVASVAGTGAISSSGGTAPVISIADAGTATVGAVQLSDSTSSTSTTTAATPNSVKSAYDLANLATTNAGFEAFTFGSSGIVATLPRSVLTVSSSVSTSQVLCHTLLIPHRNLTVSNIAFVSAAVASSGLTLCQFGIYTRSGSTFTKVAETASDTTLFNATSTKYTRALSNANGFPLTYALTAGSEYYVSLLQIGTTPGRQLAATGRLATAANTATGVMMYTQTGRTTFHDTSTGTIDTTSGGFYAELS
jgi:hypothetical protein